jgi:hypothetical protein
MQKVRLEIVKCKMAQKKVFKLAEGNYKPGDTICFPVTT